MLYWQGVFAQHMCVTHWGLLAATQRQEALNLAAVVTTVYSTVPERTLLYKSTASTCRRALLALVTATQHGAATFAVMMLLCPGRNYKPADVTDNLSPQLQAAQSTQKHMVSTVMPAAIYILCFELIMMDGLEALTVVFPAAPIAVACASGTPSVAHVSVCMTHMDRVGQGHPAVTAYLKSVQARPGLHALKGTALCCTNAGSCLRICTGGTTALLTAATCYCQPSALACGMHTPRAHSDTGACRS